MTTILSTHGHSGRIEHPDRLARFWRAGFFLELHGRSGTQTWVHYAIPTIQPPAGRMLRPTSIIVRCRMPERETTLSAVHIYDGEQRIAVHERTGQRPRDWQDLRFTATPGRAAQSAIGVSLNFQWGRAEPGASPRFRVQIASVACEFDS